MATYFEPEEFYCKCCGLSMGGMDQQLIKMLDEARWLFGHPIYVNSGNRCLLHNMTVGGSETSSHLTGLAVDIRVDNSTDTFRLVTILLSVGFKRIGVGDGFIHVDVDPNKPSMVMWTYY